MRLHAGMPSRALKSLMQEAGIPTWQRSAMPLVYCGDDLAAVPGIGIDARFLAAVDADGYDLIWKAFGDGAG